MSCSSKTANAIAAAAAIASMTRLPTLVPLSSSMVIDELLGEALAAAGLGAAGLGELATGLLGAAAAGLLGAAAAGLAGAAAAGLAGAGFVGAAGMGLGAGLLGLLSASSSKERLGLVGF